MLWRPTGTAVKRFVQRACTPCHRPFRQHIMTYIVRLSVTACVTGLSDRDCIYRLRTHGYSPVTSTRNTRESITALRADGLAGLYSRASPMARLLGPPLRTGVLSSPYSWVSGMYCTYGAPGWPAAGRSRRTGEAERRPVPAATGLRLGSALPGVSHE